jgi:hypothetical protein
MKGNTNAQYNTDGKAITLSLPPNPSGLTLSLMDGQSIWAVRQGNIIIVNADIILNGTYSGPSSTWVQVLPQPTSLVKTGETLIPPWILYAPHVNAELHQGCKLYMQNGYVYSNTRLGVSVTYIVR